MGFLAGPTALVRRTPHGVRLALAGLFKNPASLMEAGNMAFIGAVERCQPNVKTADCKLHYGLIEPLACLRLTVGNNYIGLAIR